MKYLLLILAIVIAGCSTGGDLIMPFEPEDTMTYRFPVTYGVAATARVYGADYNIIAVDTVIETFTVAGDQTLIFTPGVTFEVNGSTGNDGDWVVNNSAFFLGNTIITVTGNITNAVADGVITPYTIPFADELRIAFWDTVGGVFVQDTICLDSLQGQWTNQRCGIGYKANGQWGVAHVEAVSNDLEYWQNATANWIASGAWNLLDDDNSNIWIAVDVKTRQNYVWATPIIITLPYIYYIDLAAGVPNWTMVLHTVPGAFDNANYSMALDEYVQGYITWGMVFTTIQYAFPHPSIPIAAITYYDTGQAGDYPQVLGHHGCSEFYTNSNALHFISNLLYWPLAIPETIYTATALTSNYKAAHNPVDDTIHVILVDNIPNANELIYLRRTPNGWSAPITLQTGGGFETFTWPQITCDSFNNVNVYYIHDGDLVNLLLPSADYPDFATPGNWDKTVNVDGTGDVISHCNAISNMPENI